MYYIRWGGKRHYRWQTWERSHRFLTFLFEKKSIDSSHVMWWSCILRWRSLPCIRFFIQQLLKVMWTICRFDRKFNGKGKLGTTIKVKRMPFPQYLVVICLMKTTNYFDTPYSKVTHSHLMIGWCFHTLTWVREREEEQGECYKLHLYTWKYGALGCMRIRQVQTIGTVDFLQLLILFLESSKMDVLKQNLKLKD